MDMSSTTDNNKNDNKDSFTVTLSFKGKTIPLEGVTTSTTARELHQRTKELLFPNQEQEEHDVALKILFKGKQIVQQENDSNTPVFSTTPKKTPKLIVMASSKKTVETLNSKRSDPTIRGFDNERKSPSAATTSSTTNAWGDVSQQDRHYKFVRFEECTAQSFGHRAGDSTPHAFAARALLEKLASDPGIIAIMKERELVVNTLGEMDPIDDRIMQQKESHGDNSCLLGYNTNHGLRIDVRLRTLDLKSFLPYPQIVSTLIHELSHNWVSEHDLLFWTNFGQMRAEYLHTHLVVLAGRGIVVKGQSTAQVAGLSSLPAANTDNIFQLVMTELQPEMAQHGLHPRMIAQPIQMRCQELQAHAQKQRQQQQTLSGANTLGGGSSTSATNGGGRSSARELALQAAESRARRQQQQQQQQQTERSDKDENGTTTNNSSSNQEKKE